MRKYFCDRCGDEINFETLNEHRSSDKYAYDISIDAWTHGAFGSHFHAPIELCTDCMMKLEEIVTKFMKASCSN